MSGPGDNFGEDVATLENVRLLTSTEYLREYTGVLAETNERVHIITLAPELADIDAAVDAFTQVVDTWYNASANANILTIRDRDTEPQPWIAVPDDAETLATIQPDLSPDAIETIVSETADALRTLGLYNTVHGHLSPDDIYIQNGAGETGELIVEIGGFGLEAAISAAVGEHEPTAYTAPELVDSPNQPTGQTDVYGLAAVTYFALAGQPPVDGADLEAAIHDGPTTPPSTYDDAVPSDLDEVVVRALSTLPEDRYDSPYAFGRAFLSTFAPDDFRPEDTGEGSDGEAEAAESAESGKETSDEEDDDSPSDDDEDSTASDDTDQTSVTRRAAVGLLGMGALAGSGWYLSRGQLTAAGPAEQTTDGPAEETATPAPPAEPSASISVTPAEPSIGEEIAFSAADSTTGEEVSLETYEWAVGTNATFAEGETTRIETFSESGEQTVRLRITDSEERTATATTTVTVELRAGAPMFQYNAANTGTNPNETGPQTSISEQWSYVVGGSVFSAPAVVDGTVYVGSQDQNVYALSAEDGTEQWTYQTGAQVRSTPAVVDGTVYVGSYRDHTVYALSADDGTEQWSYETGDLVESSPAVVDGTVYVGSWDSNVYALSADDGTELWSYQTVYHVQSSPAVVDGTVYVGAGNFVYALSADDGTEQWSYRTDDDVESSPAVVGGTVYIGSENGTVYALSADDGAEQWSYKTEGAVDSSPAVVNGTVYVGSDDHNVYALSTEDGTEQWSYQTGGEVQSPAVVDGTVYVGSYDDNVYALSADDGTEQWSYQIGRQVQSPAVVDGIVYVGSYDDNMYTLSESPDTQQAKLIADDGDSEDTFGTAVAVSSDGTTAIIGAGGDEDPHGSDGQFNGGSAYVFDSEGGTWTQQSKLTADDGDSDDEFGRSVAVSSDGSTALISAFWSDNTNGTNAGSVYVFSESDGSWTQQSKLTADDGDSNDWFGRSVAVSSDGATAIIGAMGDDRSGGNDTGSAYVFNESGGSWSQQAKLSADDGDSADRFGNSVAVSNDGTTAIIGARLDDDPNGDRGGSAYVFESTGGPWTQQAKLSADDGDSDDNFGWSVSVSGDGTTVLIGAQSDGNPSGADGGSAYVFDSGGGSWTQQAKLAADDGDTNDLFGRSVAVSSDGTTALVGASFDEDPNGNNAGSGYIFENNNGSWTQQAKLAAADGDSEDYFGTAVAVSSDGTSALIGAPLDEDPNGDDAGSAYVFNI